MLGLGLGINKGSAAQRSVLERIGIASEDIAFFQSFRRGKRSASDAVDVRRASDSATATIKYRSGVEKDRIYNQFANGDGRFGTIGATGTNGTIANITGGFSVTGDGLATTIRTNYFRGTAFLKTSATRKHFLKLKVFRPVGCSAITVKTSNTTTVKTLDVTSQVAENTESWVSGIITQTDLGTTPLFAYVEATFPDNTTQSGKLLKVKYSQPIEQGDTSADPLYSKSVAEMETWLSQQQGAIAVDGSYYLTPYGLKEGELDLDQAMTFCGTSTLYVTGVKGQSPVTHDSVQSTAANQPELLNNGLWYPLGLFDGTDDFLSSDLPDITVGPCTWWARVNIAGANSYVFSRNGADPNETQYSLSIDNTGACCIRLGSVTVLGSLQVPINRNVLIAISWDGVTMTPTKIVDGILTVGTPASLSGTLTSRPNKFIGCRSNNADGSAMAIFMKGEIQEIGIVTKALTADQIQKLWRL